MKRRVVIIAVCLAVTGAASAIVLRLLSVERSARLSSLGDEEIATKLAEHHSVPGNDVSKVRKVGARSDRFKRVDQPVAELKRAVSIHRDEPDSDEADRDEDKPGDPDGALRFRRLQLQDEKGEIPLDGLQKAREHVSLMKAAREERLKARHQSGLPTVGIDGAGIDPNSWQWLGPGNVGGRIRSIVIHPANPDLMWLGSVGGGIWRTTNAGAAWQPVDDFLANLAVSTMVIDPISQNIMYAGTGEGFGNSDALQGAGIFKTTDFGVTWNQLASTNPAAAAPPGCGTIGAAPCPVFWSFVNRLAVAADGSVLLAATNSGIARSTDGGTTWTQRTSAQAYDIDFVGASSTLAVVGERGNTRFSNDGGQVWTVATFSPAVSGRIELATAPLFTVYASVDQNGGEVYRSVDGGQNYTRVTIFPYAYLGAQGWYDNAIWVNPLDSNSIIVGGIHLHRGLYDPKTQILQLSQISLGLGPFTPHADHHVIVSHPGFNNDTNRIAYFGNDGGIWRCDDTQTADFAQGWTELNNTLGITQFYGAAVQNATGVVVGGAQDNGTQKFTGNTEGWTEMFHSDGGFVSADQTDARYIYGERQNLQLVRSTDGGNSADFIFNGITDACPQANPACNGQTNFIAPLTLDPIDPNTLLAGGWRLWRSTNVRAETPTWASIKDPTGGNSPISAIAVSPITSSLILVGHNNGDIYRTLNGTDAAPAWGTKIDTAAMPKNRFVTRLVIDPNHDTNWYYATFGGFSGDNVWRSTDGGTTWADITGGATGLPSVPVRALAIHPINPRFLYVGTEIGIFTSEDAGATWNVSQDGPANVSVDELFFRSDNTLYAVTHGRGIYRTSSSVNVPPQVTNVNDSGTGSLRDAVIRTAAVTSAEKKILFNISGSGVQTINLTTEIPPIDYPVLIDGWSQGGAGYTGPPLIELNGAGAGVNSAGLIVNGGGSTIRGLVINRFTNAGIVLQFNGGNKVQGCYIGTNAAGTAALGNGTNGISINSTSGNIIGRQTNGAQGNLISGNAVGILLIGSNATGNSIRGNYIGTDVSGNARLSNTLDGIRITDAPSNTIGGTDTIGGNIISGNGTINFGADGIEITGAASFGNMILGNYIGLGANGNTALGNLGSGVRIENAPGTIIGGADSAARNVIVDNRNQGGVSLIGIGSSGTLIQGNYLGTNLTGQVALPNNASNIYVESANNQVRGNLISGYSATGGIGVYLFSGTGNIVQSNYIGTNVDGTAVLSGVGTGIEVRGGSNNNLIGGAQAGLGNLISGNFTAMTDAGSNTVIQGNYVGTNAAGTAAVPNQRGIIVDGGTNHQIGGTAGTAGNVISGNGNGGSAVRVANTTNSFVQGNRIGTNAAGTAALGNGLGATVHGVHVFNSTNTLIGGSTSAARNIISANSANGINISSGSGTVVQGNYIGTDVNGTANFGNGQSTGSAGIEIDAGSHTIGGPAAGAGNIIAFSGCFCFGNNFGSGIRVFSTGNRINSNSIFGNAELGIDLAGGTETLRVTANDNCDPDTGPNNLQNFPVLATAISSGASVTVTGSLNSTANTSFRIELFSNTSCDTSGNGEGQTYLGFTTVTTNASCNGSFNIIIPASVPVGRFITATASDPSNNTSEFSGCLPVACGYAVTPASQFFPVNGGSGSLNLLAGGSACAWSAGSSDDWITITSAVSGSGNATINFAVGANLTRTARQGTINIAGINHLIVQDGGIGGDCDFSILPSSQSFSALGGGGTIQVIASERCGWQAVSNAGWVTITSDSVGIGKDTVTYSVDANPGSSGRTAIITIGGKGFVVKQKGS